MPIWIFDSLMTCQYSTLTQCTFKNIVFFQNECGTVVKIRLKRQNVGLAKFLRQWVILLFIITFALIFINIFPRFYIRRSTAREKGIGENAAYKPFVRYDATLTKSETDKDDPCEIMHIGIVCAGHNSNLYLHTLLKSIYFYRVNPIHFHILTNKASKHILKTLFDSWNVPQVYVTFYDMNEFLHDVRWIPNSHYSGVHGLMKLVFPKAIAITITDKILVLDTDLTVVSDIYDLWKLFKKFTGKQSVGIVENQSDYYLGINTWPAINRGYNSGVLLYKLSTLNDIGWPNLWSNITKKTALFYGSTRLADQDIINAVLKEHPYLLYEVPCEWNTQLSDHTLSHNCYKNAKVKIVHWNSPKKYKVDIRDGDYFRSLAMGFQEYNGNLLRKKLQVCDIAPVIITNESEEFCSEFRNLLNTQFRTMLYFREYDYKPVDNDVTFVAQLSYDRLQRIEELVKFWTGPISLTLYVSDAELVKCISFMTSSEVLKDRTNIAYHAVFKDGEYYPINKLRNVGLKNAETPYVFLADIDFLPSKNMYINLVKHISDMKSLKKKALVVPAFEIQKIGTLIPRNKKQLLTKLEDKSVIPFLSNVWAPGHAPTDCEKWKASDEPYQVQWKPDYEPYIVVYKDVVEYNEKFVGFGWNKVSHIMELEAQNYQFVVLPNVFIVHTPHTPSYDIARFRSSPIYRLCLQMLKEEFIMKLNKNYNRHFEYTNSSMNLMNVYLRRKRNSVNPGPQTTVETNTDYPSNSE